MTGRRFFFFGGGCLVFFVWFSVCLLFFFVCFFPGILEALLVFVVVLGFSWKFEMFVGVCWRLWAEALLME